MRSHRLIACLLLASAGGLLLASTPARAGARERKIKRLEADLARLQSQMRQALVFRAKYKTLRGDTAFMRRLLSQDRRVLKGITGGLNAGVVIEDAFLSWIRTTYDKAIGDRGKYRKGQTFLWIKLRFGLQQVRDRAAHSVKVDVISSTGRSVKTYGPYQRRAKKLIDKVFLNVKDLYASSGRYKLRVTIRVGTRRAIREVPFNFYTRRRLPRPRTTRPGSSGADNLHSM